MRDAPLPRRNDQPAERECALCQRSVPAGLITLHHLTPRQKGGKAEHRTPLCRPCHKQLHAIFSNTELAKVYPTLGALRAAPQLAAYLKWIRKQQPGRNCRTLTAVENPEYRRRKRRGKW
jgi:hypothetical protein